LFFHLNEYQDGDFEPYEDQVVTFERGEHEGRPCAKRVRSLRVKMTVDAKGI
jgi:hypothetical protein